MPRSLNSFDGGAVDHVPDEDSLAAGEALNVVGGGLAVLEVADREEALGWAASIADGCRCPQQVRELMDDPES